MNTRLLCLALLLCVCGGLPAAGCGDCDKCDKHQDCIDELRADLEDVPDDPEFGQPYNWEDYCADGYVSDNPAEIYFCNTMYEMCECQREYNDCVEDECDGDGKVDVDCEQGGMFD